MRQQRFLVLLVCAFTVPAVLAAFAAPPPQGAAPAATLAEVPVPD